MTARTRRGPTRQRRSARSAGETRAATGSRRGGDELPQRQQRRYRYPPEGRQAAQRGPPAHSRPHRSLMKLLFFFREATPASIRRRWLTRSSSATLFQAVRLGEPWQPEWKAKFKVCPTQCVSSKRPLKGSRRGLLAARTSAESPSHESPSHRATEAQSTPSHGSTGMGRLVCALDPRGVLLIARSTCALTRRSACLSWVAASPHRNTTLHQGCHRETRPSRSRPSERAQMAVAPCSNRDPRFDGQVACEVTPAHRPCIKPREIWQKALTVQRLQ
jgi:hypothetical protein